MKRICLIIIAAFALATSACCSKSTQTSENANPVIENIMTRRSIRKYKDAPVGRDTMKVILDCGINAPNAINRQAWEIRVVDNPQWLSEVSEVIIKGNPQAAGMAEEPGYKNVFRNAPTVAFIANDTGFGSSPVDCGLMGENMVLAAWSMGVGSVILGSPVRFFTVPETAPYLESLGFSEGYELLFCIAFGYPDEAPDAKPRDTTKYKFID